MARLSLPSNYLATLAATALTRSPSCKVEIEYGAAWHDVSADVISASITQTMENRADEAQISLANPDRLYSLLWSDQADPPTDAGHRVRISMTNAPADLIQVFQGYIVNGSNKVARGEGEAVSLQCMDSGRKAWLCEITMEPRLSRVAPTGGGGGYRSSADDRQINAIVTAILEHASIGFAGGDISLASLDYPVGEWKPGTFNPMQDIGQLLGVKHHFLRFNHEGKAVSAPIIPTGASTWTYGALHANPLLVSFDERWQEPQSMASVLNVVGSELYAMPEQWGDPELITTVHCHRGDGDFHRYGEPGSKDDYYFTCSPLPTAFSDVECRLGDTSYPGVVLNEAPIFKGMRDPPYAMMGMIYIWWSNIPWTGTGEDYKIPYLDVELWGRPRTATGGAQVGSATNTTLAAAGYAGVIEEHNDYVGAQADCEWLAQRRVTDLANDCQPATLMVPCNLVHEPGDLITVNLDKYGGAAALAVNYIIRSHRIEYERGKPNLSTLDLVRDTTHMWT